MQTPSPRIQTVSLAEIVQRSPAPVPWAEGDNIPWDDPDFSRRMLAEHLSQKHDLASRRSEKIDRHVEWIHAALLNSQPARILDLGCGPGLYAARLAKLGHAVHGVDFSPASIAYAREQCAGLNAAFIQEDLRTADFGQNHDLVMLLYGEMNVFRPSELVHILNRAWSALRPGGQIVLEPSRYASVRKEGFERTSWWSGTNDLFSEEAHIVLEEHCWDSDLQAATIRYFVIETGTGRVLRFAQSVQAYTDEQICSILAGCGFGDVTVLPALTGADDESQAHLFVLTARKPG